ncbi:MAG: D-galactonate dehydratase family protein [Paraglaciecola sp.]|nr:D-galactonate dehydratase family protein [Paraglaciecola sp.]
MKIRAVKVIVTCPGRNFVSVKIETDEGIYGVGDATLNGRELAVASYIQDHMIPCLIGRDASQIEDIWQFFYRGAYWRRGSVKMTAIAAIDMALWDIKAKAANMPLYQLLGGKSRHGVLVYGHANGKDLAETVDEVGRYIDLGYKAIRAQSGIPGLAGTYGVSKDKAFYEPADADLPSENIWSTSKYLNFLPTLFSALRSTYGNEPQLLHDVHHRLTPIEAARLGKDLEPYHLFWLEDAVPAELQEGFRLIRQHTITPLAVGEVFSSIFDCQQLITEQLIDYIRTTIVHAGGISHLRKVAALAEIYHIKTGFHGATDLSPITMGCALHFDTWVSNFGIQEYMPHTEQTNEVFPHDYHFAHGYLMIGDKPGHGTDINEALAAKYPYQRAYLPINRLEDGSMFNW